MYEKGYVYLNISIQVHVYIRYLISDHKIRVIRNLIFKLRTRAVART